MKDYADRAYVHGRIHALMDGFPGRARYAEMYNAPNAPAAFAAIPGPSDETDISRIKEHLFRENIYPVIELIEASAYYRPFLVSAIRLAEWHNLLLLAGRLDGIQSGDEWLDISPYDILPGNLNKTDITRDEILSTVHGTYLEGIFTQSQGSALDGTPDRFIRVFLDSCAVSARCLELYDRKIVNFFIAVVMTLVRMSDQYRYHEYYNTVRGEQDENSDSGKWNIFNIPAGEAEAAVKRSLKQTGKMDVLPYLNFLLAESMRIYRREWDSSGTVTAYLVRKFILIRNLFVIAEGFRFGLKGNEMAVMIVCEE